MKVAIHNPDFPNSFAEKWIEYCIGNNLEYIIVNCLDTDIISILKKNKITHLLWHFGQTWQDLMTARNILFSAELMGIKVFPDLFTSWHFDDKVSQKYLLESMDIEMAKSYVFYDKKSCHKFIQEYKAFPIVAKLRRGSGSTSVKLLKTSYQAKKYANRMFSKGLTPISSIAFDAKKRLKAIKNKNDFKAVLKKFYKRIINTLTGIQIIPNEFGYVYFQEFIPNNSFDTRIIVIGDKAYAFRRMVRKNDFRASGSGNFDYSASKININCISKAFDIAHKLKTSSVAIDFVADNSGSPLVLEVSYCFVPRFYDPCEGYWDTDLYFHKGSRILEFNIIEDLFNK